MNDQTQKLFDILMAAGGNYFVDLKKKSESGAKLTSSEKKLLALYDKGIKAETDVATSAVNSTIGDFVTSYWIEILCGIIALFFVLRYFFKNK